jgi:hypothetical protein
MMMLMGWFLANERLHGFLVLDGQAGEGRYAAHHHAETERQEEHAHGRQHAVLEAESHGIPDGDQHHRDHEQSHQIGAQPAEQHRGSGHRHGA